MVDIEGIKAYLADDWKAVSRGLREYLDSDIQLLNTTNGSLLANSGKQLRPMLALLVARAVAGAANADTVRYAVASELLHNATLLHDDVADDADQRRGKPTLRSIMGPSVSVLVGDFWLVRAMRAILDASDGREKAIALFADTLSHLAEGEMLQLQKAGTGDTSLEDYLTIIYDKTASLFVVTCRTAALSVGADDKVTEAMAEYGRCLGCAFQMMDDIFDYTPDAKVGKAVGVDILEQKITLPLLGALASADAAQEAEIRRAVRTMEPGFHDRIVDFVRQQDGIAYARKFMEDYISRAVASLEVLPESREKEILTALAEYMAKRSN